MVNCLRTKKIDWLKCIKCKVLLGQRPNRKAYFNEEENYETSQPLTGVKNFLTWTCLQLYFVVILGNSSATLITFIIQFSSVQSLSRVWLFATPWITARQASLSITNSRSSLRLTSIESVMPSSHPIFCRPLLLLPPIPASIRVFSNKSTLRMRWPKYWSFSFSIIPSKEIPGLISFRMDWLQSKGLSRVFSNTTVQKYQFFGSQLSF